MEKKREEEIVTAGAAVGRTTTAAEQLVLLRLVLAPTESQAIQVASVPGCGLAGYYCKSGAGLVVGQFSPGESFEDGLRPCYYFLIGNE
ncbi:hypothetical protein F0562_019545 [Nyssa sinensis]|uniref:Uncharacterized protein n=1 Tax=Nyssa sinensis TaxID=561372 RepID=A0A5J5BU01_9ASTE|nr:hypothetical protein F0562_019545 [Nyssa sinensis]